MNQQQSNVENPFFHRGPVRDRRYFFGRVRETRQAFQFLRGGQCVSIVGPRRIGKTSFLFHLRDAEVQRENVLEETNVLVYVDCQALRDVEKAKMYDWLWQEARGELVRQSNARQWRERVADFEEFRAAVRDAHAVGFRPILLLDEFETMATNSHLDKAFFSDLRSLVPDVAYVTASACPLYELTYVDKSVLASPFFNSFKEIPLGLLTPQEAEDLIRGLLEIEGRATLFSQEDLDFIFSISGYHPFFIQLACYHLFEQRLENPDTVDYESVRQRYARDARPHFRYIWERLTPEERKAVQRLSAGKGVRLGEELARKLCGKCLILDKRLFSTEFAAFVKRLTIEEREPFGNHLKRLKQFFQPLWRRFLLSFLLLAVLSLFLFGPETLSLMIRQLLSHGTSLEMKLPESTECGSMSLRVFKPDFVLCGRESTIQIECYESDCCNDENRRPDVSIVPHDSRWSIRPIVEPEEDYRFRMTCLQDPFFSWGSSIPLTLTVKASLEGLDPVQEQIEVRTSCLASLLCRLIFLPFSFAPIVKELRGFWGFIEKILTTGSRQDRNAPPESAGS